MNSLERLLGEAGTDVLREKSRQAISIDDRLGE